MHASRRRAAVGKEKEAAAALVPMHGSPLRSESPRHFRFRCRFRCHWQTSHHPREPDRVPCPHLSTHPSLRPRLSPPVEAETHHWRRGHSVRATRPLLPPSHASGQRQRTHSRMQQPLQPSLATLPWSSTGAGRLQQRQPVVSAAHSPCQRICVSVRDHRTAKQTKQRVRAAHRVRFHRNLFVLRAVQRLLLDGSWAAPRASRRRRWKFGRKGGERIARRDLVAVFHCHCVQRL